MKAYRERGVITPFILNLTFQPQVSAAVTPGKSPLYALNRKLFGLEASLDVWKREK
jgi:hypothetical protein